MKGFIIKILGYMLIIAGCLLIGILEITTQTTYKITIFKEKIGGIQEKKGL